MKVTKEVRLTFGVSRSRYEVHLPAGLRVKPVPPEPMRTRPEYFLDEFPQTLPPPFTSFPRDSFIYHDARHYGIRLTEDEVQDAGRL